MARHPPALVIHGDNRAVLQDMAARSILCDSVVTDPPYEFAFMGKQWDATGIAYSLDLWREVLRVLKPGGHLLAFGGTRTYHRMTCAIEDAGFEVRDSLHWLYGTGFPKSLTSNTGMPEGQGTALKPGHEPIVLARKPLEGTVAANVQKWGTGGLNIDGCRIGTERRVNAPASSMGSNGIMNHGREWTKQNAGPNECVGRWPANVLLDEDAAAELDAHSGFLPPPGNKRVTATTRTGSRDGAVGDFVGGGRPRIMHPARDSGGGASRFFYVAKPSRQERGAGNNHPTVKPLVLMRYLVRLVTPSRGLVLDPFAGSGTTGLAAMLEGFAFAGIERDARYVRLAERRIAQFHHHCQRAPTPVSQRPDEAWPYP